MPPLVAVSRRERRQARRTRAAPSPFSDTAASSDGASASGGACSGAGSELMPPPRSPPPRPAGLASASRAACSAVASASSAERASARALESVGQLDRRRAAGGHAGEGALAAGHEGQRAGLDRSSPTSTTASRSSSTRPRWSVRRTPPANTSETSFSSRSAAASPARSRSAVAPGDPAHDQIGEHGAALAELPLAPDRVLQAAPVGEAGDRVGALAVAGDLAQAPQLGAGRDALPLVARAGGRPREAASRCGAGCRWRAACRRWSRRWRRAERRCSARSRASPAPAGRAARRRRRRWRSGSCAASGTIGPRSEPSSPRASIDPAGALPPSRSGRAPPARRARRRVPGRARRWPPRRSSESAGPRSGRGRPGSESSLSISYRPFSAEQKPLVGYSCRIRCRSSSAARAGQHAAGAEPERLARRSFARGSTTSAPSVDRARRAHPRRRGSCPANESAGGQLRPAPRSLRTHRHRRPASLSAAPRRRATRRS